MSADTVKLVLVTLNPPEDPETLRCGHCRACNPEELVLEVTTRGGSRIRKPVGDWENYKKLVRKYKGRNPKTILYQRS